MILSKAVGVYHSLCTAGKWDVNHNNQVSLVVYWNCGEEGHVCGKCNMPKDQAKIDAAHKKWQAASGPAQAGVKTQGKRKKCGVPDTKKQEEVKTESGDDVAPPSTAPKGDSIAPAGMHTVMVNKAQANTVLSQFRRNSESSEMAELIGVIHNILSLD